MLKWKRSILFICLFVFCMCFKITFKLKKLINDWFLGAHLLTRLHLFGSYACCIAHLFCIYQVFKNKCLKMFLEIFSTDSASTSTKRKVQIQLWFYCLSSTLKALAIELKTYKERVQNFITKMVILATWQFPFSNASFNCFKVVWLICTGLWLIFNLLLPIYLVAGGETGRGSPSRNCYLVGLNKVWGPFFSVGWEI